MSEQIEHESQQIRLHIDGRPHHCPSLTTGAALSAIGEVESGDLLYRGQPGDRPVVQVDNTAATVGVHDGEHFYTGRGKGQVVIFINGRRRTVRAGRISYEELPPLAFDSVPTGPDIYFSIEYRNGPRANPRGELAPGGSVELKNGMTFNVTPTNRS